MIQPYPLTGTLPTPSTRKRLPLRLRSNGLRGSRRPQFRPVCAGNAEVGFLLAGCRAGREQFNRLSQSSQVQTIADYAKLSLSNDQPSMLSLKKFIPCYAAALCIKTHAALLALCDAPHNASSRTGIRTWLLPSLVHKPRKAAENASCCCEAGSLAISKAWPMVIWSFRNASATGGIRSASRTRPYTYASLLPARDAMAAMV